jgi:hypothetical protein
LVVLTCIADILATGLVFFGRQVKLFEVDLDFFEIFSTGRQLTCLTFEDKCTKRRQVKKIGCNQSFLKRRQLTYL